MFTLLDIFEISFWLRYAFWNQTNILRPLSSGYLFLRFMNSEQRTIDSKLKWGLNCMWSHYYLFFCWQKWLINRMVFKYRMLYNFNVTRRYPRPGGKVNLIFIIVFFFKEIIAKVQLHFGLSERYIFRRWRSPCVLS